MLDTIRDADAMRFNTVHLEDLLRGVDRGFRAVVLGALTRAGFDLTDPLANLQHPSALLELLGNPEAEGFGATWSAFTQALSAASRFGILMDLSCRGEG